MLVFRKILRAYEIDRPITVPTVSFFTFSVLGAEPSLCRKQ